jgi:hypothetical protein
MVLRPVAHPAVFPAARLVVALQAAIAMLGAAIGAYWFDAVTAAAVAAGSGCALAGGLAYVIGQRLVPGRSASRLLWGHLTGEALKVAVALGLLLWGLSAEGGPAAAPFLTGFIAALLAYPLALPLATGK